MLASNQSDPSSLLILCTSLFTSTVKSIKDIFLLLLGHSKASVDHTDVKFFQLWVEGCQYCNWALVNEFEDIFNQVHDHLLQSLWIAFKINR